MPEPPASRDRTSRATPAAPAARDGAAARSQPTESPSAPGAAARDVVSVCAEEAEKLAASGETERAADAHARLALLAAELGDDANRHIESAESHPLAPRLMLARAVGRGAPDDLESAQSAIDSLVEDNQHRAQMLAEVAEAWLFRCRRPDRAAQAARLAAEGMPSDERAAELGEVLKLALAAAGEWQELASTLSDDALASGDLDALAEAGRLLLDRVGDASACADLLAQVSPPSSPEPTGDPAVDRGVFYLGILADDAARAAGWIESGRGFLDREDRRRRRAALLASDPNAAQDAAAARFELARELAENGEIEEAAAITGELATEDADADWGRRLARKAQLDWHWRREVFADVASTLEALGSEPGAGAYAVAYLARAAEIAEAYLGDGDEARRLWSAVAEAAPNHPRARRSLERSLLDSDPPALAEHLRRAAAADERAARAALRWGAAVVESEEADAGRALEFRAACIGAGDAAGHLDVARLHARRGEVAQAARAYAASAENLAEGRERDALACSAGALLLAGGELAAAAEILAEVGARAPADVVARVALRNIYRHGERWAELVGVLEELAELFSSEEHRVAALRELAQVANRRLGDKERAKGALSRLLEREPDDFDALVEFGRLCGELRDYAGAVSARERATELVSDPAAAVGLWLEIGDIEENRRGDEGAALAAYERAFQLDETSLDALRAAGSIYRRRKEYGELLRLLRAEVGLVREPPRLLAIYLEIARLSREVGESSESALDAYREALAVDPKNENALSGVERIARAEARWDVVADVFATAPQTEHNLAVLAEAHDALGRDSDVADALRAHLEIAAEPGKRVDLARRLAHIRENRLGDEGGAADAYQCVVGEAPEDAEARGELARLLRATARYAELEGLYEQELAAIPAADRIRQIDALRRLAALRRDHLGKSPEAADAFEAILELEPGDAEALSALDSLYRALGRERDLSRVLELRAEAAAPEERAALYAESAQLAARRRDVGAALASYRSAFEAAPSNTDVFLAFEELAREHGREGDLEEFYRAAAEAAASGHTALPAADLYERLGDLERDDLGKPADAAASYARALEADPHRESAVERLEMAHDALGSYGELARELERRADRAGRDDVRIASLRRAAVLTATELGDEAETARLYERLLDIDPADDQALTALESHYERTADWDRLVEVLLKRLAPMPDGEEAAGLLQRVARLCEEQLRDEQRAIEFYRRILDTSPGNSDALDALARIYESTERWSDFIDVTRKQIRITTDRSAKALLYFKCGSVMEAKFEKEEDAIRYYDAAIKTSPSCLPAVHGLRDLYRRREDWPRVIQTLELEVKLWQDDKERAGVFAQIGRIYAESLGDPERALHYYESALSVDPDCVPANRALFEQYFAAGQWELAQPLAQTLAQKAMREGSPAERSEFYRKYGVVARMTGDLRAAAESMVIGLEIQPDNIAALDDLGELVKVDTQAYDFEQTFYELEKIYRKREGAEALLARVMVTQAILRERDGDLDAAEALYAQATEKAPGDFAILSSLVDLHVAMRRFSHASSAIEKFLAAQPRPPLSSRVAAMLRRGEIHADGEMDPHRALAAYREVTRLLDGAEGQTGGEDPVEGAGGAGLDVYLQEAYYRLAQEAFWLGRFDEARDAIQTAINVAAAPGRELKPETLARYYYYLGRIAEARGEARSAPVQYRRAAEYDPVYPAPSLALARRLAESGDRGGAESLLIGAAHEAMEQGGPAQAVPLQRGLAQILLMGGDRAAAIEAFRGILAVEPSEAADRLALAEIYAGEDLNKAIAEIKKILDHDLWYGPAYRQLAAFYSRAGEAEPAVRALSLMEVLGFAEESDRGAAAKARAMQPAAPLRHTLTDDLRDRYVVPEAALGPVGRVFSAASASLAGLFSQPPMGEGVAPLRAGEDPELDAAIADVARLFGVQPEVFLGDRVPGGSLALAHPRPVVILDRDVTARPDPERRFVLGRAMDSIRGEYAFILGLTRTQRDELRSFLRLLVSPREDWNEAAREFFASLSPEAARAVEEAAERGDADVAAWMEGVIALSRRAGLLACDDFNAATHAIARQNGEALPVGEESALALGRVVCGPDLVRYYLSDAYDRVRATLTSALPVAAPQA